MEESPTRAQDCAIAIKAIGGPEARPNLSGVGWNSSCLRIIRVDHGGLRKLRVVVAKPIVQGEVRAQAELVLRKKAPVANREIRHRISEGLRKGLPALGRGGVAAVILRE